MTAEPPAASASPPFAGYERLKTKEVVGSLWEHSQTELAAVESYERANQNRQPVLDKLRFMRQPEPLPGYDALSPVEIVALLGEAELDTIKRVRSYERKFGKRREVMDEVVRAHSHRRAMEPAAAATPYAPTTYRSTAADQAPS
jgi:hypothetical protein